MMSAATWLAACACMHAGHSAHMRGRGLFLRCRHARFLMRAHAAVAAGPHAADLPMVTQCSCLSTSQLPGLGCMMLVLLTLLVDVCAFVVT